MPETLEPASLATKAEARKYASYQWEIFLNNQKFTQAILKNLNNYLVRNTQYKRLLAYLPLKGELDLSSILLEQNYPVYLPQTLANGKMIFRLMQRTKENKIIIEPGFKKIPGPASSAPELELSMSESDLIITPGLACNSIQQRLGQGGGYYDRYKEIFYNTKKLILLPKKLTKLNFQAEPHDIKMDITITE